MWELPVRTRVPECPKGRSAKGGNISPPLEMYAGGGPTSKKDPPTYISSGRGHAQPIFFRFFSGEKKRKKIIHFWVCVGEGRGHAQPILFRFFSGEKKRNKINVFF